MGMTNEDLQQSYERNPFPYAGFTNENEKGVNASRGQMAQGLDNPCLQK